MIKKQLRMAFFIVVLVVGAFLFVTRVHPVLASVPVLSGMTQRPFSLSATSYLHTQQVLSEFSASGVLMVSEAVGNPGIPYLLYRTSKGALATKELIFNGANGCDTAAGEYPCVPNIGYDTHQDDIAPVPAGTPITIQSAHDDQALIVDSYTTQNMLPAGMQVVTLGAGQTTQSSAFSISADVPLTYPNCVLGEGCVAGTPRVPVTLSNGKTRSTYYLVPGTIQKYGSYTLVMLSVTGKDTESTYKFLVIQ